MVHACLKVCLAIVFMTFVSGQGTVCPSCTNKYDHTSCTLTQSCGADWNFCELIVEITDYYSLEYACREATECITLGSAGCHPEVNKTCFYCCDDPITCQIQRDDLYNFEFPASGLLQTSATAGSS